jgi:tetratricopeptide (TPR) repeat protein
MRVGLNSGEVVVRAIGNDLHMDYSAVGETTVLAARMEQTATPGTIRLPNATLRLVEGLVQVTALGPVPVKGLPDPVTVFELTGASTLRRRLQATEFLYETRLFPEQVYTFKHALTHEVAYGSLLLERRRILHAYILEALETLAPERGAEQVELLAHHAVRGEVWDKAVTYCQQAGARAHDRAVFREAMAAFERALQALDYLPESGNTKALAIELRLALGGALNALGMHRRHLALLGEAEALARALDDRVRLGQALAGMVGVLRLTGDHDGAMVAGRQAIALAVEIGDSALQVQASHRLGQVYETIGDFGRAAELMRQAVEAVDREAGRPGIDMRLRSQAWLATILGTLGTFAEGRRHGEEALRLVTLAGQGTYQSWSTLSSATCTSPRGIWSTPSGCWSRGWSSVVPPVTGTYCA